MYDIESHIIRIEQAAWVAFKDRGIRVLVTRCNVLDEEGDETRDLQWRARLTLFEHHMAAEAENLVAALTKLESLVRAYLPTALAEVRAQIADYERRVAELTSVEGVAS